MGVIAAAVSGEAGAASVDLTPWAVSAACRRVWCHSHSSQGTFHAIVSLLQAPIESGAKTVIPKYAIAQKFCLRWW